MKLFHIINSLELGGAETLVSDLIIESSRKYNYDIDLIVLNGIDSPLYQKLDKIKDLKIHKLNNSLYSPKLLIQLYKLVKQADVIHFHLFPTLYWVVISHLLSNSKAKLIYTEHSTHNNRRGNFIFKVLDCIIYRRIDKIVCISKSTQVNLLNHLGDDFLVKSHIINNGVNLERIVSSVSYDRESLGLLENDVLLIQIASFREAKDQATVIKSLKYLPNNYKILFIGIGPLLEPSKELAMKEGVNDRIFFLGHRTDVEKYIKLSNIVIVSSKYEGFGIVAVEGMACKKPVIASNVTGLSEVVKGFGLLFEKGNSKELSDIILSLKEEKKYKELSDRCFERSTDFDISTVVEKYHQIYTK